MPNIPVFINSQSAPYRAGARPSVNCPTLMTDGVASLFRKHLCNLDLSREKGIVLRSAYSKLVSRDPMIAWTNGQWMTERSGGSVVSYTESLVTYAPDEVVNLAAETWFHEKDSCLPLKREDWKRQSKARCQGCVRYVLA